MWLLELLVIVALPIVVEILHHFEAILDTLDLAIDIVLAHFDW